MQLIAVGCSCWDFLNILLILRSKDDEPEEVKPEPKPVQAAVQAEPKPIQLKEPEKIEEVDSAIESESSSLRSSSSESSFESESKEVETEDFDEDTEEIEDFEEEPVKEVSYNLAIFEMDRFLKYITFEVDQFKKWKLENDRF